MYPGARETTPNPYPSSSYGAPGSQQHLSPVIPGNQVQGGQPYFVASPGIIPSNQLGQGNVQISPATGTVPTNFKESKTLGGIQVVIGSMHIGFGIILGLLSYTTTEFLGFGSLTFLSGYPFWGGICFIISGSLSITTFKEFSPCLIKSSLGMNIVSSIFSLIGAILLLVDLCINGLISQAYWAVISGKGISAMLMIFSLLEFCITCATAHFTKQMVTNTSGSVLVIPAVYANNLTQESSSAPPRNDGYPAYAPKY
ncbi:LOW QUALITY PROTEIN: membrane-spanning 4-domains subfamily A member 12-like [Callospermophilus lateralis]